MSHAMKLPHGSIASIALLGTILATGAGLAAWKYTDRAADAEASANQPEPMEAITVAPAAEREHRRTTTSIGTVLALQSITLRNEIAGTVDRVRLTPGQVVESGVVLVALDASVEAAELEAQQAQAALAKTTLDRLRESPDPQRHLAGGGGPGPRRVRGRPGADVAHSRADRQEGHPRALPGPGRHRRRAPGSIPERGRQLTTLQGVADAAHVDFTVAQRIAAGLQVGDSVAVYGSNEAKPMQARIVAVDARVDPDTRNAMVRARLSARPRRLPVPRSG